MVESAESLDDALVVVDGGVVGHDGIGGAERHDELATALGEGAEVGVLRVEIGRELGGVGVDVRAEVDVLQRFVFAEDPVEKIQVPVRGLDGTAERNAIEKALASHGMVRAVEEFSQGRCVFVGERGILLPRQCDDGLDVLRGAARIGDELACRQRNFPRRHVFIRRSDDVGILLLGERAFLQDLIVPQEVGMQRCAAVRSDGSRDAIVVLRITLRLLQRLLTARRATAEIRKLRCFPVMRSHDLLSHDRHEMRGAIAEVLPYFLVANAGVGIRSGTHVRCRHRVTCAARTRETARIDLPRRPAIAESEKASIPFLRIRQPDFDMDVRALGRIENQLHNRPCRRRIALHGRDRPRVDFQCAQRRQLVIASGRSLAECRTTTEQRGEAEGSHLSVHGCDEFGRVYVDAPEASIKQSKILPLPAPECSSGVSGAA